MPDLYIGLISGTSLDGVDAVLARFTDDGLELLASLTHPYPSGLKRRLQDIIRRPEQGGLDALGRLDREVGECFGAAAQSVLDAGQANAGDVAAIGSHGQTLRHRPDGEHPFSLQIGDPATIAAATGIATVADFRRADIAAGGQGAPLVPPFHAAMFGMPGVDRVVLNLGGIANITVLPGTDSAVLGFDTGPGNTLLDAWIDAALARPYDENGDWAAGGALLDDLLGRLLADPYFRLAPPKSTGFEHFNLDWLRAHGAERYAPADVQATLAELTAVSVAQAIREVAPGTREVFVCGGGVHNADLVTRLDRQLPACSIESTAKIGLAPDSVEATAFAWLAMRTMNREAGNLPSVTGAHHSKVLGALHYP